jgi:phospholipid/cholesterol/gamma-HCH transport system permease protein
MKATLSEIGSSPFQAVAMLGAVGLFFVRILGALPRVLSRPRVLVEQIFVLGAVSMSLILVGGLFVGLVMGLQFYSALARFGATSALGGLVALSLLRELSPVVTALLYAGRAGTSLASELGLMRATEQFKAMEVMAVDPVRRVVAPRFLAGVISVPLLTAVFSMVGILGGYLVGVRLMGLDPGVFWTNLRESVRFRQDFLNGEFKALVFGVLCTLVALYEGFHADPTAEGLGRATTRSVVIASLAVLAGDYLMTAFLYR